MTTVDLASMGLDGPPVIQVSQVQLRAGTSTVAAIVRVASMQLGGGTAPPPLGGRVQVASALLFAGTVGPTPGQSLLVEWDGARWVRLPVVTWNGTAWVGPT